MIGVNENVLNFVLCN